MRLAAKVSCAAPTAQEAFERWLKYNSHRVFGLGITHDQAWGIFLAGWDMRENCAVNGPHALRNDALEEAAKECEDPDNWTHKITFGELAAAIRRKKK